MNEVTSLVLGSHPDLWPVIEEGVARDGDFAVRDHLSAGFPVYYCESDTPSGLVVKEYPDGRCELVRHNRVADEVIRSL